MNYKIRQATPQDAPKIAPLIYEAIGDIAYRLTGETELTEALAVLETMVRSDNNRHTYKNTFVIEDDELLGIAVLYDGMQGKQQDAIWMAELEAKDKLVPFDVEAYNDEYYIDTLCVTPHARGKGIGSELLAFAEQQGRLLGYKKLALNVEKEKDQARKLYGKLGFVITEPWTIIEEPFDHMVKNL